MGLEALVAFPSWETALPRLSAEEVEQRRRWGPAAERLRGWGPRMAEAVPRALSGWWPFAPPESWQLTMTLTDPEGGERELAVDQFPLRIGRSEGCALQLPHAAVSTEHAEIQLEREQALLMDLRSTNGTRRNGQSLTPLAPVVLQSGDRIELGPYALAIRSVEPAPTHPRAFELRASEPRPRAPEAVLLLSHPSDRWVRVRWAGETCLLRLSAPWIRACWQRFAEVPPEEGGEIDPMEEGAAQFVLHQAAKALGEALGQPVELGGWLTPAEASAAVEGEELWLASEVWISTPAAQIVTSLLFPVPEPTPPRWFDSWSELPWPASVCLGVIRLRVAEWRELEPGDALLPDVWWPEGWSGPAAPLGDLGAAFLRLQRTWHGGRLLRSETGVKLRLDTLWLPTPGGDWLMAEEDALATDAQSLPVQDLELQVAIELARFPVTVGEIRRWRAGEVLTLRQGPSDPVRLVVETGMQRRVLGEGRVVLVNGKLGIEILRILTQLEDSRREPPP